MTASKQITDAVATLLGGAGNVGKLLEANSVGVLAGAFTYRGLWNAATNSPALADGTGTDGDLYIVSPGGSTLLDGEDAWHASDFALFVGQGLDLWIRIANDGTRSVSGVAGDAGKNMRLDAAGLLDGRDPSVDGAKLDLIEALADVTDEANVRAALTAATDVIAFNGQNLTDLGTLVGEIDTSWSVPAGSNIGKAFEVVLTAVGAQLSTSELRGICSTLTGHAGDDADAEYYAYTAGTPNDSGGAADFTAFQFENGYDFTLDFAGCLSGNNVWLLNPDQAVAWRIDDDNDVQLLSVDTTTGAQVWDFTGDITLSGSFIGETSASWNVPAGTNVGQAFNALATAIGAQLATSSIGAIGAAVIGHASDHADAEYIALDLLDPVKNGSAASFIAAVFGDGWDHTLCFVDAASGNNVWDFGANLAEAMKWEDENGVQLLTLATTTGDVVWNFTGDIEVSGTVDGRDVATDGIKLDGLPSRTFKSFAISDLGSSGQHYLAGFYEAPAADVTLTIGGTVTQTLGTAGRGAGAHAFAVASGAGGADLVLTVSGISVTDAGVRTPADSEVVVADTDAASTNQYFETVKKWLGQITYTLTGAAGAFTFNYGFAKYEDFGNLDFTVKDFEVVLLGGAAESGFIAELLHHQVTGWTYSAAAFVPGGTAIVSSLTDYTATNDGFGNGEYFAYKRAALSTAVIGSTVEGVIIRLTTGTNNSIDNGTAHVGVTMD